MLEVPERIKELYTTDSVPKKLKIAFYEEKKEVLYPYEKLYPQEDLHPAELGDPWLLIENDRIVSESFTLTESLCESDNIEFGSACAAMVEFTCADVIEDMTGKEFIVFQGINEEYELILGTFTVDSVELQDNKRFKKVKAYDRMLNFAIDVSDWYNSLTFPMKLKEFRKSLCEWVGIKSEEQELVNDEMLIQKTIETNALNGREVLKRIGEINGTFPHIQRTGELKFICLSNTGFYPSEKIYPEENIYPFEPVGFVNTSQWRKVDFKEYIVPAIDLLQFRQEENDVGVTIGNGNNLYIVQGNFLIFGKTSAELITIASNMYENIKERCYRPHTTICNGIPFVEVGDGITVVLQQDAVESFVLKRTMKGIQSLIDEFSANGVQERKQNFGIKDQITQLQGKSAILKRTTEELSNTITDVEQDLSSKISQTVDSITAEVKRAKEVESSLNIRADGIETNVTNFKEDTSSKFEQTANTIMAEVKRATEAESNLSIRSDGIETNVSNFKEDTNSKFEQTADQISLKVSKGEVSSQLSIEEGQVTISSNRLIIESTNFRLSADGTIFANNGFFMGKISGSKIGGSEITGADITGSVITSVGSQGTVSITDGKLICSSPNEGTGQLWGGHMELNELKVNNIKDAVLFHTLPSVNGYGYMLTSGNIYSNIITPSWTGGGSGPNVGLKGVNIATVNWCNSTFQRLGVSDFRLKKDIQSIKNIKNIYMDFKVKSYKYKDSTEDNNLHFGLLAQQVLHTLAKNKFDTKEIALVEKFENRSYKDEGMYTGKDSTSYRIRYEELHAFHIQMIQEQQKEINLLKKELTELKELVEKLDK